MRRFFVLFAAAMMAAGAFAQTCLPNPLKWEKREGEVKSVEEWNVRRGEIARLIQEHEIGIIPEVKREQVMAEMRGDTLCVTVCRRCNILRWRLLLIGFFLARM